MPKKVDRNKKNHRTKEDSIGLPYESARAFNVTGDDTNPIVGTKDNANGGEQNRNEARNSTNQQNRGQNQAGASRRNGDTSNQADASRRNGDTSNRMDAGRLGEKPNTPAGNVPHYPSERPPGGPVGEGNTGGMPGNAEKNCEDKPAQPTQNFDFPPRRPPQGDIKLPGFGTTFPIDENPQPGIPGGKTYLKITDAEALKKDKPIL